MGRFFIVIAMLFFGILGQVLGQSAQAKPVPFDHYARMPAIYDAALSPNGDYLAIVADNNGRYIVRVLNITDPNDKKVRAIAYAPSVKILWVKWANNDVLLVSTGEKIKFNRTLVDAGYLYALNKDLTDSQLLIQPKEKKQQGSNLRYTEFRQFNNTVLNFLPSDPDHILMSYGLKERLVDDVIKVNVRTKAISRVKQGDEDIQSWVTDMRGEVRMGLGTDISTNKGKMIIRDANSKDWRSVKNYPGLSIDASIYGFTENPNEIIVGGYNGKNTAGLFIYDLVQKRQTRTLFQHDKYDVRGVVRSPDGKKVVGVTYIADVTQTKFFDPKYQARMDAIHNKLGEFHIQYIDQTPDGRKIVFKASSPSIPSSLMLYDTVADKVSFVAADYPEIGNTYQGDVTAVKYAARDGFKIPAYITTPPKIADGMPFKNLPFIVLPHGGPYSRDTKNFDYLAQFLTSRGYAVLQMNFRGSEGYGKEFKEAGRKNWVIMQEDVEDGARWLIEKGYADPERICIFGWSYGGYAALMGAIKNPDLYTCAVSMAGVTDLKDMIRDLKKYQFGKQLANNFVLRGFKDSDAIKENSPVKRASEITIPLMLAHGKKDTVVYYDQFTRMRSALKASKAPVTYLSLEDESHYLDKSENRHAFFETLDAFLADNLGPSEAAP
jgi:dipeptidyl aminopeptidase/acylaminoacyl peptidase